MSFLSNLKMKYTLRVLGVRKLQRQLKDLKLTQMRRILASSMMSGMRPVRDTARRMVPSKFRHVRPHIHIKSMRGKGRYPIRIKVGSAVKMDRARQAAEHRRRNGTRRPGSGVGISGQNWHWPVLGTKRRYTRTGKYTGRMPRMVPNFMNRVWSASQGRFRTALLARGRVLINNLNRRGR
jgi:hypothetical protein